MLIDTMRTIAEEFSILRRDAVNLTLFIVIKFMITQQIEIRENYTRRITNIQRAAYQLVHDLDFARQLQLDLENLNRNVEVQRVQEEINHNNVLNNVQNQLDERITGIQPNVQLINTIVEEIQDCIALEEPNYELLNDLHFAFTEAIATIVPLVTALQQFTAEVVQMITDIKKNLEGNLPDIMNMLPEQERTILQTVIEARALQVQSIQTQALLQSRMQNQRRSGISNAEALVEQQLATQIRVYLMAVLSRLQRLEEYETQNQNFLEQNEHSQHYFLIYGTITRINAIISRYGQIFQQVEIIGQQLHLMTMAEQTSIMFPDITNVTFWSHVYRKVALDPNDMNAIMNFHPSITRNFNDFDLSRKRPGLDEYLYQIPPLDYTHRAISHNYGSTIIQTNRVATSIVNHTTLHNFTFQNEEESADDYPGFDDLYTRVFRVYNTEFGNSNYEAVVNDYSNATNHPLKYLRASYRLLKIATAEVNLKIKLWNLLPDPGHSIVFAPLSGVEAMYGIFRRASLGRLPAPDFLLGYRNELVTITEFKDLYSAPNDKRRIWESIFILDNLQHGLGNFDAPVRLGYGTKTDGYMISIIFEKDSRLFIPLYTRDVKMQKRNIILQNWQKGMYPLYKSPTGITENDRIIGTDHGNIHEFMKSYRHRENKGYAFSNRQASQDHAARVVIGTTHTDEPFKLCHTSTSKRRYRKRRLYRETIKQIYSQRPYPAHPLPIRDLVQDSRRTVVAYGDASLKGTYKGNTPVPVKSIQRAIANKAIVIPVDEFRTSVTCSHCLRRLENVYNDTFLECNHR
ncbi:hypothetical protein HPULCUR_006278 [Helicostylum pulchrum]|uniref:Uncharacterized protein n=1 Tax=Helicostylum pulchrum TaxID=562976 RepID=A0ABP9Y1E8_9FUNG